MMHSLDSQPYVLTNELSLTKKQKDLTVLGATGPVK